ncbi:MAG: hypothetical protein U1G07_20955 [Verrucomicrobiota bacterium]
MGFGRIGRAVAKLAQGFRHDCSGAHLIRAAKSAGRNGFRFFAGIVCDARTSSRCTAR